MSFNLRNALSNAFVGGGGGGGATLAANTFTGAQVITANGAASTPGLHITGVPFAGTGTTSFPQLYVNDSAATASTVLNTAGTMFGVNANGAQDLMNLLKDGASRCKVDTNGNVTAASTISAGSYFFTSDAVYAGGALGASQFYAAAIGVVLGSSTHVAFTNGTAIGGTKDLYAVRAAAAHLKLGLLHATTATNQTLSAHNVTTGTGADLILAGGTGSVANGNVRFGTHAAVGVEIVTGYITIKDEGGTLRKLAVIS